MKKVLAILLCLCLTLIPMNVTALDSLDTETIVTDSAVLPESDINTESELTEIPDEPDNTQPDISIEEDSEMIEMPIDDGGITITPTPGSPEEQAIQKILAHKKALGEEIPVGTQVTTQPPDDGAVYYIKNYFSGKYLNVHYGVDANGTNVYQWTGDSSTEQKFKIVKQSSSYSGSTECYKIYAMCSSNGNNRVIDVVRNSKDPEAGQNVDIWTPIDDKAQKILLTPLIYDNLFHMQIDYNTQLYITSYGNSNGTSGGKTATSTGNVFIKEFNVNDNQQWQLIKVPDSSPVISDFITGNRPYRTSDYTLSQGGSIYIKFTPTESFNCSIYTSSLIDTYIEIYSDAKFTNLIASNDDDGHLLNALMYFNVTANTNYYIKIRGYSDTTSGDFKFVLHRGLPTSRSEKGDLFDLFNDSQYVGYNTCYTYMLGYHKNPRTKQLYSGYQATPGGIDGDYIEKGTFNNSATAKTAIEEAVLRDCNFFNGDLTEISKTAQPKEGYYKVALFLAPGEDYHWYRQLPNGRWVHKLSTTEATDSDASGNIIYDPQDCNRDYTHLPGGNNYTVFLGWYEIKTPAISLD